MMPKIVYPLALTLLRLVLAPLMPIVAWAWSSSGPLLVVGIYVATLSDIFDGIVARRLGVATVTLRRLDSITDAAFWICTLLATWILRPAFCQANLWMILTMLALEAAAYALSFAKFRRDPAMHADSAKAWGLVLLAGFTAILGFGESHIALPLIFCTYVLCWLDVIAILALLPTWQSDIPSFYHALLIRRGLPIHRHRLFHSTPAQTVAARSRLDP